MSSIQNISNAPKDTNVSLSYVGGLLFPGTSGNRLLMSYYIDWGITFNDSGEIHSTYDFVNYLLNKNIAISNNLQNCVDQVNALSQRVDDLSTTLSSNISSINTQLSSLSSRIDRLEGNQTVEVTKITVNAINTSNAITYGNTATATASVEPSNASNKNITWSSNNPSVATINASTGAITPVKAGTFTITATANDGSGVTGTSSTITVNKASQTLQVSANPSTIEVGGTTTAKVSGNKTLVTWSSSNAGVATVNSTTGLVTGISGGTATITATAASNQNYNEGKGTVSIKVNKPAETYYYYYGIQDGTLSNPSSPINADNYKTLAESSTTLKDSMTIEAEKGYAYVLVPNSVTEVKWFDLNMNMYSSMKFDVIDTSIPGHLVYKSEGPFYGGNVRLDFTYGEVDNNYYYYYGIQDGTLTSPSSPITSSNYKTLAESSTTLKDSMTIEAEKGYAYVLVPNSVTEVKWFDLNMNMYSSMKFDVIDTSIPGHLVYKSEGPFYGGNVRLDFTY